MAKIFYLGPEASYCDLAKSKFVEYLGGEFDEIAKPTIIGVIKELASSDNIDCYGVIPIENSVEGVVREAIDNLLLLKYTDMKIVAEVSIPVNHCLVGFTKSLKKLEKVISHPQAIAQCYDFIMQKLGENITISHENSTALAVKNLSKEDSNICAIGSEYAAKLYNVPIIRKNINDKESNTTRFVLIGAKKTRISGNDKTGFSFTTANQPGALCKILNILEKYQINMTYIDSRPSKKNLGEYVFYVDIDGHALSTNVSKAIFEILQNVRDFQYFGSYVKI